MLLPRPLGGSCSTDSLVPVVAAALVAQVCTHIAKGHIRLDAALTGPAADQPHPPTGP